MRLIKARWFLSKVLKRYYNVSNVSIENKQNQNTTNLLSGNKLNIATGILLFLSSTENYLVSAESFKSVEDF